MGIPAYLLSRGAIGNTGALFVMLGIMLPAFMMDMYEKDGLPFEKVLRNILNTRFLRPGVRPYQTQNIYAPFTGKEEPVAENKKQKQAKVKNAPGRGVCPADDPLCGDAPGRYLSAPRWALYENGGI